MLWGLLPHRCLYRLRDLYIPDTWPDPAMLTLWLLLSTWFWSYRNTLEFYDKLRSWVSAQDPIGLPMFLMCFYMAPVSPGTSRLTLTFALGNDPRPELEIVNRICTCARSQRRLHSPTKLSPYRNTLALNCQLQSIIILRPMSYAYSSNVFLYDISNLTRNRTWKSVVQTVATPSSSNYLCAVVLLASEIPSLDTQFSLAVPCMTHLQLIHHIETH